MAHIFTGNKFDPNVDIPDLSGKVRLTNGVQTALALLANMVRLQTYIVTGGTSGIGLGITAHLLQHNASKIILVSQKEEHAAEAQEVLEKYGDINSLEWIQCDFKDLKRTVQVAEMLKEEKQIDAVSASCPAKLPRESIDRKCAAHLQRWRRGREVQ